ncbi:GerAB/ArcD/ProY family transporter [Paenibacillus sp. FJAT-26967]|uniref:GerAB/ArcD/ProY family transporter n=1 Tax=Paenibacillus sp. FJAT-26967 TaxID=1729690 RepID=UPI000838A86B|nr:GerAB/ArcD/ProY family transporter [Paenibacillus sp. FJAT-26967]
MITNRYFYYLIAINALISIIIYVPRILLEHRFTGTWSSILISVPISIFLIYAFCKMLAYFPRQGFPELMERFLPRSVGITVLVLMIGLWYFAGALTLLSFVDITLRYISLDVPGILIMLGFLIVVFWSCKINTASILYALELLLVLTVPLVLFFIIKAMSTSFFSWDAVIQSLTYSLKWPDLSAIAGATFLFTGYINMVVFNRVFEKFQARGSFVIALSGLLLLVVTVIVPIGYHGSVAVDSYVYPWFSLADSIRIDLFLVERMVFVFYLIYIALFLISTTVHWHVAQNLTEGLFKFDRNTRAYKIVSYSTGLVFSAGCLIMLRFNQKQLVDVGEVFLIFRLGAEVLLLIIMFYMYRKGKKSEA